MAGMNTLQGANLSLLSYKFSGENLGTSVRSLEAQIRELIPFGRHVLRGLFTRTFRPLVDFSRERSIRSALLGQNFSEVNLPYSLKAGYLAYPSYAYPLGIVAANGLYESIVFSLYGNIFFPRGRVLTQYNVMGPQIVESPRLANFSQMGFFNLRDLTAYLRAANHRNLLETVADAIGNGEYLYGNVNEYYIPGLKAHKKYDHRHPLLIVGRKGSSFTAVGYDFRGRFSLISVDGGSLVSSLLSRASFDFVMPYYHGTPPLLQAYKWCQKEPIPVNIQLVKAQVLDYLNSRAPSSNYLKDMATGKSNPDFVNLHPAESEFGFKAILLYKLLFKAFLQGDMPIDLRTSKVLTDFTNITRAKITYLQKVNAVIPDKKNSDAVNRMANWASAFHLKLYAYGQRKLNKSILESDLDHFEDVAGAEAAALNDWFN